MDGLTEVARNLLHDERVVGSAVTGVGPQDVVAGSGQAPHHREVHAAADRVHEYDQRVGRLTDRANQMAIEPHDGSPTAIDVAVGSVLHEADGVGDTFATLRCAGVGEGQV